MQPEEAPLGTLPLFAHQETLTTSSQPLSQGNLLPTTSHLGFPQPSCEGGRVCHVYLQRGRILRRQSRMASSWVTETPAPGRH